MFETEFVQNIETNFMLNNLFFPKIVGLMKSCWKLW